MMSNHRANYFHNSGPIFRLVFAINKHSITGKHGLVSVGKIIYKKILNRLNIFFFKFQKRALKPGMVCNIIETFDVCFIHEADNKASQKNVRIDSSITLIQGDTIGTTTQRNR